MISLKTLTGYLILYILAIGLTSCKKKEPVAEPAIKSPVACYNSSTRLVKINDVVTFQNCSENFDRVEWNFGDGTSSTISEPSHIYDKRGIFEAVLTVFKGSASSKIS